MAVIPFIAIEGPIGIGKSSLAKKLAVHFDFYLLEEIVEENPFLDKFYDDINAWGFQTEMFFLCNRIKQLEDIEEQYLSQNKAVIADYHIFKNMIFSKRTLQADKLQKYKQIYPILTQDLPMPNIVIYLHASLERILERIQMRGREVEQMIAPAYLKQLIQDYDVYMQEFEKKHPNIPVIRINGDNYDFIRHQDDLNKIIQSVQDRLDDMPLIEGKKQ